MRRRAGKRTLLEDLEEEASRPAPGAFAELAPAIAAIEELMVAATRKKSRTAEKKLSRNGRKRRAAK